MSSIVCDRSSSIDPTLAARSIRAVKINYQLEGLRTRFVRAQMTRDEAAHRQLQRVSISSIRTKIYRSATSTSPRCWPATALT